jgi:hypothetical protein
MGDKPHTRLCDADVRRTVGQSHAFAHGAQRLQDVKGEL